MTLVNLHTHTRFSDGERTITDLLFAAKTASLSYLAVTDHDTFASLSPEVVKSFSETISQPSMNTVLDESARTISEEQQGIIKWNGLTILRGVEYSFLYKGTHMHMVGLGMKSPNTENNEESEELKRCERIREVRYHRLIKLANEINIKAKEDTNQEDNLYKGIAINIDELDKLIKDSVPSREHLGFLIAKLKPGLTACEAMERYVTANLENYPLLKDDLPSAKEVIETIHYLGGVAILPHIGRNKLPHKGEGLENEIMFMHGLGLDGLEIQSGKGKAAQSYSEYELMVHRLNTKIESSSGKKLLVSIGNDDHGKYDGCIDLPSFRVPEGFPNMISDLLNRIEEYKTLSNK